MARPSKLTDDLLDQLDVIADDAWSIREACAALSIGEATWRRWEVDTAPTSLGSRFQQLAARVRHASGTKADELAWGVLREVMEDVSARPADRIAAATAALRLRTAQRVELTGRNGIPMQPPTPSIDLSKLGRDELRTLLEITAKAEAA